MKKLHIKNIEKYHPSYKDRRLIWCKTYFDMMNADPEFEMMCEIDKWRFIAFTMLEIQLQKPIPLDETYLTRKGFDFKTRKLSKTVESFGELIQVIDGTNVTHNSKVCDETVTQISCNESVTQSRVEYIKKNRIDIDKKKYMEFVYLSDTEFKKLQDRFGEAGTNEKIEKLNNYIGSKGVKYKSHYHTILNWEGKNGQNSSGGLDWLDKKIEESKKLYIENLDESGVKNAAI